MNKVYINYKQIFNVTITPFSPIISILMKYALLGGRFCDASDFICAPSQPYLFRNSQVMTSKTPDRLGSEKRVADWKQSTLHSIT